MAKFVKNIDIPSEWAGSCSDPNADYIFSPKKPSAGPDYYSEPSSSSTSSHVSSNVPSEWRRASLAAPSRLDSPPRAPRGVIVSVPPSFGGGRSALGVVHLGSLRNTSEGAADDVRIYTGSNLQTKVIKVAVEMPGAASLTDFSNRISKYSTIREVMEDSLNADYILCNKLVNGTNVTKHTSTKGTVRRFLYVNFQDCTVRCTHVVGAIQSFMSAEKGIYYLHRCYKPSHYADCGEGRSKLEGKELISADFSSDNRLQDEVRARTLSIVMSGGRESITVTFDTMEEYVTWRDALQAIHRSCVRYYSFFYNQLSSVAADASLKRASKGGVWTQIAAVGRLGGLGKENGY